MNTIIKYKANGVCYDVQNFSFAKSRQKATFVAEDVYEYESLQQSPMMQLSVKFEPFYSNNVVNYWFFFYQQFSSLPGVIVGRNPQVYTYIVIPKWKLRESLDDEFIIVREYDAIPPVLEQLTRELEPQYIASKAPVRLLADVETKTTKSATAFTIELHYLDTLLELFNKYPQLHLDNIRVFVTFQQQLSYDMDILPEFYKINQMALFRQLGAQMLLNAGDFRGPASFCGETSLKYVFLRVIVQYCGTQIGEALFLIDFKFQMGQYQLVFLKYGEVTHTAALSYQITLGAKSGVDLFYGFNKRLEVPLINNYLFKRNNRFVPMPETSVYLKQGKDVVFICKFAQNFIGSTPFYLNYSYLPNQLLFSQQIQPAAGYLLFVSDNLQYIANFGAYFLDFGENQEKAEFLELKYCYGHVKFDWKPQNLQFCEFYGGCPGSGKMTGMQLVVQIIDADQLSSSQDVKWQYLAFNTACFRWFKYDRVIETFLQNSSQCGSDVLELVDYYKNACSSILFKVELELSDVLTSAAAKIETAFLQPPQSNYVFSALAVSSLYHLYHNFYDLMRKARYFYASDAKVIEHLANKFTEFFALSYNSQRIFGHEKPSVIPANDASKMLFPHTPVSFEAIHSDLVKEITSLQLEYVCHLSKQPYAKLECLDTASYFTSSLNDFEKFICRIVIVLRFLTTVLYVSSNLQQFDSQCAYLAISNESCVQEDISTLLYLILGVLRRVQLVDCAELIETIAWSFSLLRSYGRSFLDVFYGLDNALVENYQFYLAFKAYFSEYMHSGEDSNVYYVCSQIVRQRLQDNYFTDVAQPYYVLFLLRRLQNDEVIEPAVFYDLECLRHELFDSEQMQILYLVFYYLLNRVSDSAELYKLMKLLLKTLSHYIKHESDQNILQHICMIVVAKIYVLQIQYFPELLDILLYFQSVEHLRVNYDHEFFSGLYRFLAKQIISLYYTQLQAACTLLSAHLNGVGVVKHYYFRIMTYSFGKFLESELSQRKLVTFLDSYLANADAFYASREFFTQMKKYNEAFYFLVGIQETVRAYFDMQRMRCGAKSKSGDSSDYLAERYGQLALSELSGNLEQLLSFYEEIGDVRFHLVADALIVFYLQARSVAAADVIERKLAMIERGFPDVYFILRIVYMQRYQLLNNNPEVGCFPVDGQLFPNFPLLMPQDLRSAYIQYCGDCKHSNFVLKYDLEQIREYFMFLCEYSQDFVIQSLATLPTAIYILRNAQDNGDLYNMRQLGIYLPTHYPYFSYAQPIPSTAAFRNQCIQAGFNVKTLPKISKADLSGNAGLSQLHAVYLRYIADFLRFKLTGLRKLVLTDYSHLGTTLSSSLYGVLTCWLCDDFLQRIARHQKDVLRQVDVCFFDERSYEFLSCSAAGFEAIAKERLASTKVIDVGLVLWRRVCLAAKNVLFILNNNEHEVVFFEVDAHVFSTLCVTAAAYFIAQENAYLIRYLIPAAYYDPTLADRQVLAEYLRQLRDYGLNDFEVDFKRLVEAAEISDDCYPELSGEYLSESAE